MAERQKNILRRVLQRLNENDIPLNKITLQKIIYFLRESGLPVGYRFEAWTYGPFSASLANALNEMTILGEISPNEEGYTYSITEMHNIQLDPDQSVEIENAVDAFLEMVENKFDFKTMELVGTVIYCHSSLKSVGHDPDEKSLLEEFLGWKGDKYTEQEILKTYRRIRDHLQ